MKRYLSLIAVALALTVGCGTTDAGITTDVKTSLAADEVVSAYEIDVDTREGVVTLTGDVESPVAKEQAVQIARSTEGVRDVVDNLRIEGAAPTSGIRTDPDVSGDIETGVDNAAGAVGDAARETGEAARRGAEAAAEGARKAGSEVRDAVTPDEKR